jgi:hypothetical protein
MKRRQKAMDIYKEMYYKLFNAVTDALETANRLEAQNILVCAQQTTEKMYMEAEITEESLYIEA